MKIMLEDLQSESIDDVVDDLMLAVRVCTFSREWVVASMAYMAFSNSSTPNELYATRNLRQELIAEIKRVVLEVEEKFHKEPKDEGDS